MSLIRDYRDEFFSKRIAKKIISPDVRVINGSVFAGTRFWTLVGMMSVILWAFCLLGVTTRDIS